MRTSARLFLPILLTCFGLAAPGCPAPAPPEESESGEPESLVTVGPDELEHRLGFAHVPALSISTPATRVGLMIELREATATPPALEVRALREGEPGAWRPVEITFQEENLLNARVDFEAPFDSAELRLPEAQSAALRMLAWTGIVPATDPGAAEDARAAGLGQAGQGLDAGLTALGVHSRAEWGARAARCSTRETRKHRMTVHHTVTYPDRPALRMRQMQNFHIDGRGWCDLAYHFIIALDGSIWEGRPVDRRGGHVRYQNEGNVGISYLGCFSDYGCEVTGQHAQTTAAIDAGRRLIATLAARHDIPLVFETVRGHRDWPNVRKACPGDNTEAKWDVLRSGFTDAELGITPVSVAESFGLFDPQTGQWHLHDGSSIHSFAYGGPGDRPLLGDWDCDGADTVGVLRPSNGRVYLRNRNDAGNAQREFSGAPAGDIAIAGDFNGDGCDSVSFYRGSSGEALIYFFLPAPGGALGPPDARYYFGNPSDKPFVGDFDGDGIDTLGLHRESSGLLYFRQTHTQGNADAEFYFGDPGDRLVAADWSGDGADTPAVFRPSNSHFYFRFTNTQGNADAQLAFGESGWLPVAGTF